MKSLRVFFVLLILWPLAANAGDFPAASQAVVEQDRFWADVEFKSGSTVAITTFRAWYEFPADKVFPVLIDINNMAKVHTNYEDAAALDATTYSDILKMQPESPEVIQPILAAKRIPSQAGRKKGGQWTRYEYVNFNFPWPLSNRWSVQKAQIDESRADKGEYHFEYELGVGNFKKLKGYWELVPVPGKPGWTEFRGSYESDPGIDLPKFLAKTGMKTGLKKDIDDNREILAKTAKK